MKRDCIMCGAEFTAKGIAKTCSPECSDKLYLMRRREQSKRYWIRRVVRGDWVTKRREYMRQYQRRHRPARTCTVCGAENHRQGGGTCSAECTAKQAEARRQAQLLASKERRELREQQPRKTPEHILRAAAWRALRELGIEIEV